MANSLKREIKEGERVVVTDDYSDPTNVFVCQRGRGMKPYLMGSRISGHWESDETSDVIDGYLIDPEKTAALPPLGNSVT